MRPCCQPPRHANLGAGGWWTNPKGVGSNGSYLVSWQTAYQVAVERDHGRMMGHSEVMLPLLQRGLYDFRMDFCDLIVSMEQAEISPRPVVGVIVVVSGLAVSFLLWLLYVHHASADFAGRWMFLPAFNALLNGLCAIALCVGLYFIKHHNREAHRTSMLLAF